MRRIIEKLAAVALSGVLAMVLLLAPATVATAANKFWKNSVATGNWSTGTNWSATSAAGVDNAGAPIANDIVNIRPTDDANHTVTYDYAGAPLTLAQLIVDLTGGAGATTTTFSMSANNMTSNNEWIGNNGRGTFNHSGGTNTIAAGTSFLDVGVFGGSTGTYNLSGTGALVANTDEYIGDVGTGFFNQTGGTNTINVGKNLYLGYNAVGTAGTYTLNAGTLSVNNSSGGGEYVGYRVSGTFNQNGGTNSIWGTGLHVGALAGSTGVYTLSAGSVGSNGAEYIGESGTGTFTQTGGDNGVGAGSDVYIGYNAGSSGTYNLSGSGSFGAGHDFHMGYNGVGIFNQNGGTVSLAENFTVGFGPGAVGSTYTLTAGSFSSNTFSAYSTSIANGTFNQSGGTSTFGANGVFVNGGGASAGNFILSGGTATTTDMHVGGSGASDVGVLTVSGSGVLTVSGTLTVTNSPGDALNLNGGTINVYLLKFNGSPGLFHWTSGTLNMTSNATWDSGASPISSESAFGAALALGSNQTLSVVGDELLGGVDVFALTLNAGSTHTVGGTLTINPNGTITQNAGSTLYAAAIVQAGGAVNGTLQNQGTFTYQSGAFNGRLLNQGVVSFASSLTTGNGVENDATMALNLGQTLTVNGAGLDNRGTFTMAGGILSGAGPLANNSVLSGHGTLAGTGGLANNALLTVSGGVMTLSNTGANANSGEIDLPGGQQLQLTGANLTNTGTIDLIAGTIGGTATLNNTTGTISGRGTIAGPLTNAGLLAVDGGILSVNAAFTSSGEIYLAGGVATLSGSGTITNAGLVRGDGVVNKPVNNAAPGEIRAESGKRIKLAGVNGNNVGLINLQGGTAEFSQALTNGGAGQIIGRGMLKVGGTGLTNIGSVSLSSGTSDVFGQVNNATGTSTKGISIAGNADVTFWNDVTNTSGLFKVNSGSTATFFGAFSGNGITGNAADIHFEGGVSPGFSPASVTFGGNVSLGGAANLLIELGGTTPGGQYDQVRVSENLSLDGTLRVGLIDLGAGLFAPAAGDSFDILDWGSLSGTFSAIQLPTLAGTLTWNTSQLYTSGVLRVDIGGLLGDYNNNGIVDATDYVLWRKNNNTATTLPNDATPGTNPADYDVWRAHFGQSAGSGSGLSAKATVPEPSTLVMLVLAAAGVCSRRRRAA